MICTPATGKSQRGLKTMTVSNASSAALGSGAYSERIWTARRVGVLLSVFLVLAVCWQGENVRLAVILQPATFTALWEFLRGLFPPDLSLGFLRIVFFALLSTVATAIAGTVLSVLIAIPLGALATPMLWRRGILSTGENRNWFSALQSLGSRMVFAFMGFLRAVPDLVWGLLFVTAVGLGSLAGALALAVAYAGVLGRVYADVFADVDPRPLEALQATGATRAQIFLRGIWPQALPNVMAYTLYSFECCVRAASVLGFVGAGGIGYEVGLSMRLFEYRQVLTLILAFILLLALTDMVSRELRARLQPNAGRVRKRQWFKEKPDAPSSGFGWRRVGYAVLAVIVGASFYLAGFSPEHFGEANILKNTL